jgi:hypothetical protein
VEWPSQKYYPAFVCKHTKQEWGRGRPYGLGQEDWGVRTGAILLPRRFSNPIVPSSSWFGVERR